MRVCEFVSVCVCVCVCVCAGTGGGAAGGGACGQDGRRASAPGRRSHIYEERMRQILTVMSNS